FNNRPIGPFSDFQWLLFVILPFGPIVLELQAFYSHPLQKTLGKSLVQIARAIFWLGLIIAACSYFLRLDVPSRAVMPLFIIIATVLLLVREHLSLLYYRKRSRIADLRERVILAGTPGDIHQLRHSFTPEQI